MTEKPATRGSVAADAAFSPTGAPEPHPDRPDAPEGRTEPPFEGHSERECGEHRTTGRRAWCFDCSEWCYPNIPCRGCELPKLRAALAAREETDRA